VTRRGTLGFALLLLLLSLPLLGATGKQNKTKVLVVGIDAGEWDVLGPLIDQGRCPNFARMRKEGSAGKLRSLVPATRSPVIWASIATGKVPAKHGVLDFFARKGLDNETADPVRDDPKARPVTSNLWKARPVWSILGSLGKTVGVVGWWTTWPAQPVNGTLVSDYVGYKARWEKSGSRMTYPDSLIPVVGALRREPESVSWAELFQFVPAIDTTRATQRQKEILQNLRWIYASDVTFYRIGMELYRAKRPDFFTVYFRGVDEISHVYWDLDILNTQFNPPLTRAEIDWIKPMIPNYYVFTDRLLGDLLREAGKNTDVIVCSDHGFGGGGVGVMAHKPDGIVFLMGPHMVRGGTISGATVLDITPTILATFGLPTARDMDGRPIPHGLQAPIVKRMERETRFQTYETARGDEKGEEPLRSPVDD